jgi:hypothetical protein
MRHDYVSDAGPNPRMDRLICHPMIENAMNASANVRYVLLSQHNTQIARSHLREGRHQELDTGSLRLRQKQLWNTYTSTSAVRM